MDDALFRNRWSAVSARLLEDDVDALVLCAGQDLIYLTGHDAHSWERLSAFVGRPKIEARPELFVPQIEISQVAHLAELFEINGWSDDQNAVDEIVKLIDGASRVVVSDELWSLHLLRFQQLMPTTTFVSLAASLGGLRSVKSDEEMLALQTVGGLTNNVARQLQAGEIPLVGRTEQEIAADIGARLLAEGLETVEFCIVASGPNSANPHHNPGDRVVQEGEMVLCDFGGKHRGYCSDLTRCVWTGPIPADVAATYDTLKKAQQAAFDAARPGATLGDVDAAARDVISDAGFGAEFTHRTGHGIGTDVHEQPYVTAGSEEVVATGHAFSIEPGIYVVGKWGMRLEDIVVVVDDGAIRCSTTDHNLVSVKA